MFLSNQKFCRYKKLTQTIACIQYVAHCIKANTCPVNYRMNKKLKFCYLAFEERVYYFTTGMAHCRNIGSRLAILPTLDYHWYLVEGKCYEWHLILIFSWIQLLQRQNSFHFKISDQFHFLAFRICSILHKWLIF